MSRRFSKESEKKRKRGHVGWDDELWNLRFTELEDFVAREGHTRVPARWQPNPSLGRWLAHQRELARQEEIEPDRARRLVALGVEWSIPERTSAEDERRLAVMLVRLDAYVEKHGHTGVDCHQDPELARWMTMQRFQRNAGLMSQSRLRRLTDAGFPWEPVDARWEQHFRELEDFVAKHGHTRVPAQWRENPSLGDWIARQRGLARRGTIAPDHLRRLLALGNEWAKPGTDQSVVVRPLETMLARLADHIERHGHAGVDRSHDPELPQWMQEQRHSRKKGSMSRDRLRRLTEAGFPWQAAEVLWEQRCRELEDFVAEHGHTCVPARWEQNPALGRWLAHQRELARQGAIEPEHSRRLAALGVEWTIRHLRSSEAHEGHLSKMLARLAAHVEKHGHAGVDRSQDPDLARWMQRQRIHRNAGLMSQSRIRRLTEAGFPWQHVDPRWEQRYRELEAFHRSHGHVLVPSGWRDNPALGRWLAHQREIVRRGGDLPADHRSRLEALGVVWDHRTVMEIRS